jgi:2-desacetyl-2-hydroxyethyl bacteriochlorophyllide A dehydrogenase
VALIRPVRAVAIAEDRTLASTELEERPLEPHEARVEVAFCGICGSDIHFRASEAVPAGTVMGHEFSGTVAEVGQAVEGFSAGDRVAVFPFIACGECPNCLRGDDHVCQQAPVTGLGLGANPGGYAESVALPGSMLVRIPDELSFEHGALVEPLAVALHGIEIGEARSGDRCVVIGAGPIGVMTALGLRARGIDDVLVIERNERRRERMRSLEFESLGLDGVHDRVLQSFGGEAADVVFECAGNPAAPQLAIELVRSRGIVVLLGVLEEPVAISQLVLMIKEAQVRASFAYRREEFREAVELLAAGALPADRLITGRAPLEEAQSMFERLEDPATEDLKILLTPRFERSDT